MKSQLRVLRAECQWTQAELAQRLNVSRQTVNAIETGKYEPSLSLAFRIARLFGQLIEEIFEDGEIRPEYHRDELRGGVRGKYLEQYRRGTNLALLAPEVRAAFPTDESVNEALRSMMHKAPEPP